MVRYGADRVTAHFGGSCGGMKSEEDESILGEAEALTNAMRHLSRLHYQHLHAQRNQTPTFGAGRQVLTRSWTSSHWPIEQLQKSSASSSVKSTTNSVDSTVSRQERQRLRLFNRNEQYRKENLTTARDATWRVQYRTRPQRTWSVGTGRSSFLEGIVLWVSESGIGI